MRACRSLALVCMLALAVALGGCGTGSSSQDYDAPDPITVEADKQAIADATQEQMDAIKPEGTAEKHLLKHFSCKIVGEVQVEGTSATLDVEVSNVDVEKALESAGVELRAEDVVATLGEMYREERDEEMEEMLLDEAYEAIDACDEVVTTKLTLRYSKKGDVWTLDDDSAEEFADAVFPQAEAEATEK